jgi:hypothetical protein
MCVPLTALAALGDEQGALEAERVQLKASVRALPGTAYDVVEMQTELGVAIKQYLSKSGVVFAVRWQGPFKPDLRQLLGPYFSAYERTPRPEHDKRSRTHSHVASPSVVVQSGGRPRAFAGFAYLPKLVPVGVDPAGLP